MTTPVSQPEVQEAKAQGCVWHCAACDCHFSSVAAFDAHRDDGYCLKPEDVQHPKTGEPLLAAWTLEGRCGLTVGCWRAGKFIAYVEGVTVWQMALSDEGRDRLRAAFSKPEQLL